MSDNFMVYFTAVPDPGGIRLVYQKGQHLVAPAFENTAPLSRLFENEGALQDALSANGLPPDAHLYETPHMVTNQQLQGLGLPLPE